MNYVELFAGAGGLSMGLEAAGFKAMAHAEIEPHARAVLRYRWPNTRLDGDVTQVNGADFQGVTLISGGSPCQDLSVAGKRAGLAGPRSGLFYEQVRIWKESNAPYLLWENVLGALNSNKGRDFAAVLSAIVGADINVPEDGWRRGGVASGRHAVAAWRVLDLQHFGPPQRRVRVFIVAARTGGVDPAEVLALSEGSCWHTEPCKKAREAIADHSSGGTRECQFVTFDDNLNTSRLVHGPLMARTKSGGPRNGIVSFDNRPDVSTNGIVNTLTTQGIGNPMSVVCDHVFSKQQYGAYTEDIGLCSTIGARDHAATNMDIAVSFGRPRRLTPLECERLMSWPDDWTSTGIKENGTVYALSDTARYRLCGNGVGSLCVAWFAKRLAHMIQEAI